mmetsp:Transcript_34207/g.55029  ORF Transcript_34207/g.55029 Transcript_34207/m.55029 type:complete len:184 (+) Transcript_34207:56-607(+)
MEPSDPADGSCAAVSSSAPVRQQFVSCASWQRTSLMIAARHGQLEVIALALETSCSQPQLDMVDEHGNTALMIAVREGHLKVVEALIGVGADLSMKNLEEKTAMDLAQTDEIRAAIAKGQAQVEALERAILGMARLSSSASASGSGGGSGGLPSSLTAGLLGSSVGKAGLFGAGGGLRGECPF